MFTPWWMIRSWPPSDEQLTLRDESQIAGPQKGPRRFRPAGPWCCPPPWRRGAPTPGDARPRKPRLLQRSLRPTAGRVSGSGDHHPLVRQVLAAADQVARRGRSRIDRLGTILREGLRVERADHRCHLGPAAGHNQRCFGQAVARIKCLRPESAAGESPGKRLQRVRPDRFGPVESDLPATQVELVDLLLGDPVDAKLVGEIRAAAGGAAKTRDRREPAERSAARTPSATSIRWAA